MATAGRQMTVLWGRGNPSEKQLITKQYYTTLHQLLAYGTNRSNSAYPAGVIQSTTLHFKRALAFRLTLVELTSALKMEVERCFERLVNFYQTIRPYIQQDSCCKLKKQS
jgi:hypothetical protein